MDFIGCELGFEEMAAFLVERHLKFRLGGRWPYFVNFLMMVFCIYFPAVVNV